jgi:hypothetical protein
MCRHEPPIKDFANYLNFSGMAEGLVGGVLPNVVFYFPILSQNETSSTDATDGKRTGRIAQSGGAGSRYWTMVASPVADMLGGREQSVWFRFHQLKCAGADGAPPCVLHGLPQYYDTYWYSRSPISTRWVPPDAVAGAAGFYGNMLAVKHYWDAELATEGIMELELPAVASTNGTLIKQQATHVRLSRFSLLLFAFSLSLVLSLVLPFSLSLSLSLSLSHTHTPSIARPTLSLSLSHTHTLSLSLYRSADPVSLLC